MQLFFRSLSKSESFISSFFSQNIFLMNPTERMKKESNCSNFNSMFFSVSFFITVFIVLDVFCPPYDQLSVSSKTRSESICPFNNKRNNQTRRQVIVSLISMVSKWSVKALLLSLVLIFLLCFMYFMNIKRNPIRLRQENPPQS